ncbi:MAG: DUF1289 domain-containing protein [Deltaproteobacteria bacterium]|nr:DUF1289 domain-containing protein [Deltaproteobacteria bacterium]
MNESEEAYQCIGVCTPDPASGLCQGCGMPLTSGSNPCDFFDEEPQPEVLITPKVCAKTDFLGKQNH